VKKIIQHSRTFTAQVQMSWNQAYTPLLLKSFPKIPRTRSETHQFGGSHSYNTKQNKLPRFTHTFGNMNEFFIHVWSWSWRCNCP
jgi:hypothetical protein